MWWFSRNKQKNYYNQNNKGCKLYYYQTDYGYDYATIVNPYDDVIFSEGLKCYHKVKEFTLVKTGDRDTLTDLKYKILSSDYVKTFTINKDTPWLDRYFFYQYNLFSSKRLLGQPDKRCPDISSLTPDCKMVDGVFRFVSEIYSQLESEIFETGFHNLCRGTTYLRHGGNIEEEELIEYRDKLISPVTHKTSSARLKQLLGN